MTRCLRTLPTGRRRAYPYLFMFVILQCTIGVSSLVLSVGLYVRHVIPSLSANIVVYDMSQGGSG